MPCLYDGLLEPIVIGFRRTGLVLAPSRPGLCVLDVGCGTGSHLALYQAAGAEIAGVDQSAQMLARAAAKLGAGARLVEAEATDLPFRDGSFDLAIAMTLLHELSREEGEAVLREMRRVIGTDGRILVIDHHPGRPPGIRSRFARILSTCIERLAGGDHYRNYRRFRRSGGVPVLARRCGLSIERRLLEGSGTMGIYLLR